MSAEESRSMAPPIGVHVSILLAISKAIEVYGVLPSCSSPESCFGVWKIDLGHGSWRESLAIAGLGVSGGALSRVVFFRFAVS